MSDTRIKLYHIADCHSELLDLLSDSRSHCEICHCRCNAVSAGTVKQHKETTHEMCSQCESNQKRIKRFLTARSNNLKGNEMYFKHVKVCETELNELFIDSAKHCEICHCGCAVVTAEVLKLHKESVHKLCDQCAIDEKEMHEWHAELNSAGADE